MAKDEFDAEAFVDAAVAAAGLTIAPEHRPGVVQNMERIAGLARLVMADPIEPTDEPAPVFEP